MNDIQPPEKQNPGMNAMMAMMGDLFNNVLAPSPPPMDFNAGIVTNFFHNVKLKQQEKASARQANIATSNNITTTQNLGKIQSIMLFQTDSYDKQRNYIHMDDMRQLDKQIRQEELRKLQLENQNLYYEGCISEMELKKHKKEFEEEYGDGPKPA
jgi:hypothetical protein